MDSSETGLRVSIEDNGKGFDIEKAQEKGGMGLKVIRDRVQMLGDCEITVQLDTVHIFYFRYPPQMQHPLHKCKEVLSQNILIFS